MKIGIDASRYKIKEPTGVEWYSFHLLNHLVLLFGRDHHQEVRLYLQKETEFSEELPFNVKKRIIPGQKFWTQLKLSWEILTKPIDSLFVPSHIFPLIVPKKTFITIHDLAFMYPELKQAYDFKHGLLLRWSTKRAVKTAHRIIVPSEATKADLIKFFKCPEEKIRVIYHGGPELRGEDNPVIKTWKISEQEAFLSKFGMKENQLYMLFIGRIEFKKNLSRVVEAFKRFSMEFPGWKLVLAGKPGQGYEEILKTIEKAGLRNEVILTGYITEAEKYFLLSRCRFFVFPTLCEGFGLPILEAMAFRKPILTSNKSSMPEIAGKAGYLVNPLMIAEISVGMKRLASDGMLISKLIVEGEKQLEKFTWDQAAKETWEVLNE